MMVLRGASGVPRTSSNSEPPDEVKDQPVGTVAPTEYDPPEFTVSSVPLLETKLPLVAPLLSVRNRSLIFCPIVLGCESKLLSVILIVPASVTKVADAFTVFPPEEVPAAVKVAVSANAAELHSSATHITRNSLVIHCAASPMSVKFSTFFVFRAEHFATFVEKFSIFGVL
jgi:hypothetical protein